jgi:hypothetical protein
MPVKVMYLDESGDHSLDKIDPQCPVFVLGGVILERAYMRTIVDPGLRKLKDDFFSDEHLILHTADIVRARNGFEALNDPALRAEFYMALNHLMRELDYKVVACVIKKDEHLRQFGAHALDPYMYSLRVLVDRFCREIGDISDGGLICTEKRGPELDNTLEKAWMQLLREGTGHTSGKDIDERIADLGTKDKRLNIAGLQLADLVVSPIGRAVTGRRNHEDWEIIQSKFCRGDSGYQGYGLVVLPGDG